MPKDEAESFRWYMKAAQQGNAEAQRIVGSYYMYGIGVPKDEDAAYKWYSKAVENGDKAAIDDWKTLKRRHWFR